MIALYQAAAADILVPTAEALRYAGQGAEPLSQELAELFSSCMAEFLDCAAYRAASLEVELAPCPPFRGGMRHSRQGEWRDTIYLGDLRIMSKSLFFHLMGCDRAILFCATVGGELDRLFLRYGRANPSRALLLDAIGSAAIEAWCDTLTAGWIEALRPRGLSLRPRFSPGYGDFPLQHQKEILSLLSAAQATGVSVTKSLMLTPQKSVTAVIGISEKI